MESNYLKEQQYKRAKKRVKDIKGFYSHLMVYIIINVFLSAFIIYGLMHDGTPFSRAIKNFGVYSTWLFWGIGMFFHWVGVFGFKSFFSSSWEERKIKEMIQQEDKRTHRILKK